MTKLSRPTCSRFRTPHETLRPAIIFTGGKALCAALLLILAGLSTGAQTPAARPVARRLSTTSPVRPTGQPLVAVSRAASTVVATSTERRAFDLVNAERRAAGEGALIWDAELCLMARMHSENMARQGFFSHTEPDGADMKMRARALGIRGWSVMGENIAYNQGFDDPVAFAVAHWMQSAGHRENIVRAEFTRSGLGVAQAADGRVFFTQVFIN